ncbi:MAG: 50S ribosomal protein L28 [Actinobacteria bacterium]|nr:MAG: 50S ribosomal protein L28 [Actinomycetota bacterium]
MSNVCDICGKKPSVGRNVSHSHHKTPRTWKANIQTVRAMVEGTPRRLRVCTKCLKANKITRA